jgi:3',5'-cyclic AMP phosphodiesterase CpdA
MIHIAAYLLLAAAALGLLALAIQQLALRRHLREPPPVPAGTPGISILKPPHLSDLLGRSAANDGAARRVVACLVAADVDKVLVTGDVTHRGRLEELAHFRRIVAPVQERLVVVPGNHDRLGEDAAAWLMAGRVQVDASPGLFAIRLDSTAPHNRSLVDGHGRLTPRAIAEVEAALARAPLGALVVLMLHHHLHPLPGDDLFDRLSARAG